MTRKQGMSLWNLTLEDLIEGEVIEIVSGRDGRRWKATVGPLTRGDHYHHGDMRPCQCDNGEPTAEQQARDMLERLGMDDAQSLTSGDVVELANLIAEVQALRRGAPEVDGWDEMSLGERRIMEGDTPTEDA